MNNLFRKAFRYGDADTHEVLKGASFAFAVKALAAMAGFACHVVLGRLLGPHGVGIYFQALALTTIAATLGRVGLDNTVVRFVSAGASTSDWQAAQGVYRKSILFSLIASAVTTFVLLALSGWLADFLFVERQLESVISWMALAVIPVALYNISGQALRGLKHIPQSILVLNVTTPLLVVALLLPFARNVEVIQAVYAYVGAAILTFMLGVFLWHRAIAPRRGAWVAFPTRKLLSSSIPLFGAAVLQLVNTWSGVFILGIWAESSEVGIFSTASRSAALISFVLVAVNAAAAPKFSELFALNRMDALSRTARQTTWMLILFATPVFVCFILFSESILSLFGAQFVVGGDVLSILAIGQYINVVSGSVNYLLIMSGNERVVRNNLLICASLNVLLNLALVPSYGMIGAALSNGGTLILQNILGLIQVYRKLGVVATPLLWAKKPPRP